LRSRGKFMFLDNVVHDRAEVSQPWQDFRRLGNSLFLGSIPGLCPGKSEKAVAASLFL